MAHPDAEVVRRAYAALNRRDIEGFVGEFADDAVWHGSGSQVVGGRAIGAMVQQLVQAAEGTLHVELHDVLETDDHVSFCRSRGRREPAATSRTGSSTSSTYATGRSRKPGSTETLGCRMSSGPETEGQAISHREKRHFRQESRHVTALFRCGELFRCMGKVPLKLSKYTVLVEDSVQVG